MRHELRELWRFRELLLSMVEREIRIRYKNSVLGFFWSLLNPLVTVLVMTLVFKNFLGQNTQNLSAYILAAYLPFLFFQMSLLDSSQSVLASISLVKKIYFPREILPLSAILANFIHFLLALLVFGVVMIVVWLQDPRDFPFSSRIIFLPLLLIIQFALCTGLGLLISALNTFYEDVKYIVSVLLYLLFFGCPIMYWSENVAQGFKDWPVGYTLYHANPMAALCTGYRKIMLDPQPMKMGDQVLQPLPLDLWMLGGSALSSFLILWMGYAVFNRLKWRFVERP